MNLIIVPLLILKISLVSSIVFSVPHQLASLFKMEEQLVDRLNLATEFYKSKTLDLYLQTCEPRFNQLPAFRDLEQV
jgi:hypothetical protein